MGIAERKEREKEQRRRAIVRAAKKLIGRHGVEGMSMSQLALATELNKATLYLYFGDKDDLVDAIVYEGLVLLEKEFRKENREKLSGLEKVLGLVRATFAFYKSQPVYFYTLNHQERRKVTRRVETPFAKKGNEVAARIFGQMADAVRDGMRDGSVREGIDVDRFLVILYAHMYGVTHTVYSKEDVYRDVFGLDPDAVEASALELVEFYLKREGLDQAGGER
jgi:AcrR family transcriptional regulator